MISSTLRSAILFFFVGLSSWSLTNGLFLEMPILFSELPEGYSIASYLVVMTQVGNVVGIFQFVLRSCYQGNFLRKYSVLITLVYGLGVCILVSLFWNNIVTIDGKDHSIPLFVLCALSGSVGSLSVITMIPFASLYSTNMISAISTGMGTTGLVTSILSLVQQPDKQIPNFPLSTFFLILGIIFIISILSFVLSSRYPAKQIQEEDQVQEYTPQENNGSFKVLFKCVMSPALNQLYISLLNYSLLGIETYFVVGFPKTEAKSILFWLGFGSIFIGAISRGITFKVHWYNLRVLTVAQVILWSYLISICFVQQRNKLSVTWGWITVIIYSLFSALYGYTDTLNYYQVYKILQKDPEHVERASSIVGVFNQIGAIVGSLLGFILALKALHS